MRLALFDLDDTLHDDTSSYMRAAADVASRVSARTGAAPAAVVTQFATVLRAFWKGLTVAEMRRGMDEMRTRMWQLTLEPFGVEDVPFARELATEFDARRLGYYRLFPGALDLLKGLREDGVSTGLVSNGFAATHREKIHALGLEPAFDAIFLSDEVDFVKPDPQFFSYVCTQMGASPSESAMIGDRYDKDLVGAIELGLFTVLVNTHRKHLPKTALPPNAIVNTIADVRGVLPLGSAYL